MPVVQSKFSIKKSAVATCIKRPTSAKGANITNKVIPAQPEGPCITHTAISERQRRGI